MAIANNSAPSWDSALTDAELDAGLTRHPVWYVVVDRACIPQIQLLGLAPVHDPRQHSAGALRPWTYLAARGVVPFLYDEADNLDAHSKALLAVDLRSVNPRRIRPDELEWTETTGPTFDPADYGITPHRPGPHQTPGQWAAQVQLGAQPKVSALALADGRIAVRGLLTRDRVTVVELAPGTYLNQWEQTHLATRPDR